MEELDELLRRVRREYDPDAGAQQRVRTRLGVALTAGVAAGLVAGTKGAAAAGGGVGLGQAGGGSVAGFAGKGLLASAWGKSALGVALVTGVAGVSVTVTELTRDEQAPQVQSAAPAQPITARGSVADDVERAVPDELAPPKPAQNDALVNDALVNDALVNDAAGAQVPAVASGSSVLAPGAAASKRARVKASEGPKMLEELGLLSRASQALHAGDAAKARRALEEHERRFQAGALKQERQGLSVLMDCGAESSPQARDAATRFLTASPHSPLAEAIRRRCRL